MVSGDHSPHWPSAARLPARQAWGSRVRPLAVPDQLAEVVPPAVVGRWGVAVPEVVRVAHEQPRTARPAPSGPRPRPPHVRTGGAAPEPTHVLTAATNTDEPNGRSWLVSTRSSQRHRPSSTRSSERPPGGPRRCRPVRLLGRREPLAHAADCTLGHEGGEHPGEAVCRTRDVEPGRPHGRDRPRTGVTAVVAVGDVVVGPRPLVRRHGQQQPSARLEDPAELGQSECLPGRSARPRRTRRPPRRPRRRTAGQTDPQTPVGGRRPRGSTSSETFAGPSATPRSDRPRCPRRGRARRCPTYGPQDRAQHLGASPVPPVGGLLDRRRAAVRGRW